MARPTLLYVTPVVPKLAGSGIAMRAGAHIEALAALFDVTLAIIADGAPDSALLADIPDPLKCACSSIVVATKPPRVGTLFRRIARVRVILEAAWPVPMPYSRNVAATEALAELLAGRHFDVVHCFRLASGGAINALRRRAVTCVRAVLDLDDYESRAAMRNARHASAHLGRQVRVLRTWARAVKWRLLESRIVPRFDDICICSEHDHAILRARFPQVRWIVLPNIVREPRVDTRTRTVASCARKFTFLFVGQLHYVPNKDGVLFFCHVVLPMLRRAVRRPFAVLIVGRDPDREIRALANADDIEVVANPPDVADYYARSDVAIVPLLSGGGTRIKILEAFSYGVPVVSTTIGAEGLEAVPGRDVLIADSAAEFADQCCRLMIDGRLRQQLADSGHRLFRRAYTKDALLSNLRSTYAFAAPARGGSVKNRP